MSLYPISWTKLDLYLLCPLRFYETKVLYKWQEPESEAMAWGNAVHKALEENLTLGKPLDERYKSFQPLADKVNAMPGDHYAEQKLALDFDLQPCDYNDKNNCYVRCIIDRFIVNGVEAANIDWKTGKRKPFSRQLSLSSGILFPHFQEVELIHAAYVWTQGGAPTQHTFHRSEMGPIWDCFIEDINNMEWSYKNSAWPAKPNGLCKAWCNVLSCIHNGRRKRG